MKTILIGTVAAALIAGSALAEVTIVLQHTNPDGTVAVQEFTADKDDAPSIVIWDPSGGALSAATFDAWDRNASGTVSSDEFATGPDMAAFHGDARGVLSQDRLDEAARSGGAMFTLRDADRNGLISRDEFDAGSWSVN